MMIRLLMIAMSILLLICSYYLIQKSDGLLMLLSKKKPANVFCATMDFCMPH